MEQATLVLTNLPDSATADAIARALVERRLAACINRLPGVHSVYWWNGAVESAEEVTLLIKTTSARYPELEAAIKDMHPYDLPEIIAMPVAAGLPSYLDWIARETQKDVDV